MTTVTFPYDLLQRVVVFEEPGWEIVGMEFSEDGMRYMVRKDGAYRVVHGEQVGIIIAEDL